MALQRPPFDVGPEPEQAATIHANSGPPLDAAGLTGPRLDVRPYPDENTLTVAISPDIDEAVVGAPRAQPGDSDGNPSIPTGWSYPPSGRLGGPRTARESGLEENLRR
jgi:hypothetical protein